jgi:beta-glucosidase
VSKNFDRLCLSAILVSVLLLQAHDMTAYAQKGPTTSEEPAPYLTRNLPTDQRVKDLLGRMTVEEKVRQLDLYEGVDLFSKRADNTHAATDGRFLPEEAQKLWKDQGVGAIHDLYPTAEQSNTVQAWVIAHNRLHIPALFIEEALHGFNDGTVFPAPINLAATWNPSIARRSGAAIAAETRATGVDMILAPVLDLARDPRWGRIEEDFGEDPYLTGQLGLAFVEGAQGKSLTANDSVAAEPKHFAGHGSPEGGTNTSPVHIGERELRSVMLKSFEPSIRQGHAMGIMAAYHEIDGIPITADPFLLKKILRGEWGFQGFVLSDLGAIRRLYDAHHVAATPKNAVCLAVKSGVDMQFYDFPHDVFQQSLKDCVRDGTLSMTDLDRAAGSVLRLKFALGLFDHPFAEDDLAAKVHRSPEHLALSLESARQSMTLLKNDNRLLPLSTSLKRIAVIGPNGNVARYGDYEQESNGSRISVLDGIRQLLPDADVSFNDGRDIAAAAAAAKSSDVAILVLGERPGVSGEGFDRSNLDLPDGQEALLEAISETGRPTVLVLENGRPLTIPWARQHVPAILEAWYPGEFGGKAISETLFGLNNPAGRLTITFPRSVGQIPDFYNYDPSSTHKYVDDDGKPLFPFGFGLSYTSFRYEDLSIESPAPGTGSDVVVKVKVTNTGDREGDEVAQLYVRQNVSSVETPARALKGFSRIHLKPSESMTVIFRVPQDQLAIWNADGKWTVEPGTYTVWAGGSSEASLSAPFQLKPGIASAQ